MGKIFSVSRQKTQESLLTSTNMLKQLEVEGSGETLRKTQKGPSRNKINGCLASTLTRHPSKKSVIHLQIGDPNALLDAA